MSTRTTATRTPVLFVPEPRRQEETPPALTVVPPVALTADEYAQVWASEDPPLSGEERATLAAILA